MWKLPTKWVNFACTFTPPYCPHLNPIERLWAVLHDYVTHNKVYETRHDFAREILNFLRDTIPKNWHSFRDKVTDNFQIISHQNFRILEGFRYTY